MKEMMKGMDDKEGGFDMSKFQALQKNM